MDPTSASSDPCRPLIPTCQICTGRQGRFRHAGQVSGRWSKGTGGARPVWGLWDTVNSRATGRGCLAGMGHLTYKESREGVTVIRDRSRRPRGSPLPQSKLGSLAHLWRAAGTSQGRHFRVTQRKGLWSDSPVKWTQSAHSEPRGRRCYGVLPTRWPVFVFLFLSFCIQKLAQSQERMLST